jgi:hypothetical protein
VPDCGDRITDQLDHEATDELNRIDNATQDGHQEMSKQDANGSGANDRANNDNQNDEYAPL